MSVYSTKKGLSNHKRVSSTGTTGDESYSSDEEEIENSTEATSTIIRTEYEYTALENGRRISSDGADEDHQRNSSEDDGSVYSSDLDLEVISTLDLKDELDAAESAGGSRDELDWSNNKSASIPCRDRIITDLKNKINHLGRQLKTKDDELTKVTRLKEDVEAELEDLTASLFQEAHNMVREANEKQAAAEKTLKEGQMKVDVLTAEVSALKTLVLTSTPSSPNPHLHPQISKDESGVGIFMKKHRRSPSHYELKYGRENSPPDSPFKKTSTDLSVLGIVESNEKKIIDLEIDPVLHKEFLAWHSNPVLDKTVPFLLRIFREDIHISLDFNNKELLDKVIEAVEDGTVLVEAVGDRTKILFPKTCALLQVPKLCFYRMNIGESNTWYNISQICRNRIISVCDFLNYLKYIQRGLVKSPVTDIYREIIRLRKNMSLARLGLDIDS